jgi:hypothetical protein
MAVSVPQLTVQIAHHTNGECAHQKRPDDLNSRVGYRLKTQVLFP